MCHLKTIKSMLAGVTTMNMHLYFSSVSVVPTRPHTLLPVELKYLSLDSLAAFPSPLPFDSFHACWPLRFHFATVSFAAYATSYSTLSLFPSHAFLPSLPCSPGKPVAPGRPLSFYTFKSVPSVSSWRSVTTRRTWYAWDTGIFFTLTRCR